jgi:hypothetical protein
LRRQSGVEVAAQWEQRFVVGVSMLLRRDEDALDVNTEIGDKRPDESDEREDGRGRMSGKAAPDGNV